MGLRLILTAVLLWFAAAPAAADGLGWRVTGDGGSALVLVGTVHAARPDFYPLPAPIEQAFDEAEVLVLEIDLSRLDPAAAAEYAQRHGMYPPDESLPATLGKADWTRVRGWARRVGVPLHRLERMRPWLAAVTLVSLEMQRLGLDPQLGMERHFARRAAERGLPVRGLETLAEQLDALSRLSAPTQRAFLVQSLTTTTEFEQAVDDIIGSWRDGDAARMATILEESYEGADEVYEALMRARNRRWLPEIEAMLASGRRHFVAVGSLHLVGDDGLTTMLEERGYRVERF